MTEGLQDNNRRQEGTKVGLIRRGRLCNKRIAVKSVRRCRARGKKQTQKKARGEKSEGGKTW